MADVLFSPKTHETQWPIVWVVFGAGIVASSHIGKLPPALQQIGANLEAGLVMSGWIASMISTIGFALGLVAGAIADRIGQRRVLIFGLLMLALGSLLGTFAPSSSIMLIARFIEGLGFTATTITGGAIIARTTARSTWRPTGNPRETPPGRSRVAPRCSAQSTQGAPKLLQGAPGSAPGAPRERPGTPQRRPRGPRGAPGSAKSRPGATKIDPKSVQNGDLVANVDF